MTAVVRSWAGALGATLILAGGGGPGRAQDAGRPVTSSFPAPSRSPSASTP